MTLRGAAPALLLCALAGCTDAPVSCPGEAQAALTFSGSVPDDAATSCDLVAVGASTRFPATISFTTDTGANLCLERRLTEPRACTRTGDTLSGCAAAPTEVALSGCPCAISLDETLAGSLTRSGTRVTGFTGTLVVSLQRSATAAAQACYATGDAAGTTGSCPPVAGCSARYDITGTP